MELHRSSVASLSLTSGFAGAQGWQQNLERHYYPRIRQSRSGLCRQDNCVFHETFLVALETDLK